MREYYRGNTSFEVIDVIHTESIGFSLGNVLKYICRAGHKPGNTLEGDLNKALAYLDYEIDRLDHLKKGLATRPIETLGQVYPEGFSCQIQAIGEAWGLNSCFESILECVVMANRHNRLGLYTQAIRYLEDANVLLVRVLAEGGRDHA